MTVLEGLRNYFLQCPLMGKSRINVDYLPEGIKKTGIEYSLDTSPAQEVITQYMDGGAKCQYVFVIRSVMAYGANELRNLGNSGFFEDLTTWINKQNRMRKFPEVPEGWQARKLETQSTGYLFSGGADAGYYQIQCRLLYYRTGDR